MTNRNLLKNGLLLLVILLLIVLFWQGTAGAATLKVCTTVVELGGLVKAVGGEGVAVTVLAKGNEDVHFLDAKPSFIKVLSEADLFVQVGMELEAGWAPYLLQNARNARIQLGGQGYLDASTVIQPLEVPSGNIDRSMGDIHPQGNPHYLADPLNGLKVAALLRDRLTILDPAGRKEYQQRFVEFRQRLADLMVGEKLAARYDFEKLSRLYEHGRLTEFLQQQGEEPLLGGWLGKLQPYYGAPVLTYHKSWPYFAHRFGLTIIEQLEPRPGIPPSPVHLKRVIDKSRAAGAGIILQEPWQPRKPAALIAEKTGAQVVRTAVSLTPGNPDYDYLAGVDQVVRDVVAGLTVRR